MYDEHVVRVSEAGRILKELLLRGGVDTTASLKVGRERRFLGHHPMMHEASSKFPWPFSLLQMHDVSLVAVDAETGAETRPSAIFSKTQIDSAISQFIHGTSPEDIIILLS
jgi:hypothetical protein